MSPQEAVKLLNKQVRVCNPKMQSLGMSDVWMFTAYIFRIVDNRKVYQAEVQNLKPPHEIYIVSLDDLEEVNHDEV